MVFVFPLWIPQLIQIQNIKSLKAKLTELLRFKFPRVKQKEEKYIWVRKEIHNSSDKIEVSNHIALSK